MTTGMTTPPDALRDYLERLVARYEQPAFIVDDPIAIPHGFDDPADREIIGLYAALLAWGRRATIMNKMADLCERMRYQPARFVHDFRPGRDAACLDGFKHRTFGTADAVSLTTALSAALKAHGSVEALFARHLAPDAAHVGPAIQGFSASLLGHAAMPPRMRKHLARPGSGSAAKRLAMYLRWMVRPGPVDFGLWTRIRPAQLVLPLDVHSGRQARALGLLGRRQDDWRAVEELTEACRRMAPDDPARYDYAFFGVGVNGDALDDRFVQASSPRSNRP